ncbi:multiple inositol-polyphosphate phosphatase / 2,3-bisphosphoglycerate 3-phosphatase [Entomortierella parvispora]|uniref:Multiple inositol polyphosphate phosphatase 1 n=1 Tax=Entomortierella parvispora TaxID=205924 RepID=A0A9P3H922_9FUNG|nr:multiple inositol-polyphosphate phosphatase / 2,3-bisphosphoglycerate 3-phosphatase [Entomortierella parvispora]
MHRRRKTSTVPKWTVIVLVLALSCWPSSPGFNVLAKESPSAEAVTTLASERTFVAPRKGDTDPQPITDQTAQRVPSQALLQTETVKGSDGSLPLEWIRGYLSTKSPYPHYDRPVGPLNDVPEGYELAQLQLINRHGTRFPSASKSKTYKVLADKLKAVNAPGHEWLQQWSSDKMYPVAMGNLLSAQGGSDLYQIGSRFAIRYKALLDRYPYNAATFEFRSSDKSRCSQSAFAYSLGLLKGRMTQDPGVDVDHSPSEIPPAQPVDIFTMPNGLDQELAVKYACPRWLDNVKDQPDVVREEKLYKETFLPALASRISSLFGTSVTLTDKDVEIIYGLCGFEVSFYGQNQTWCSLLNGKTEEETRLTFQQLEFSSDLDDFYTHGPGVPFNKHLGCVLGTAVQDSIEKALAPESQQGASSGMKTRKDKEKEGAQNVGEDDDGGDPPSDYKFVLKFGHSETIFFFSTFLGLYQDPPLTSSMTPEQIQARQFRASQISPFAANIAFEVYRPKPSIRRLDKMSFTPVSSSTFSSTSASPSAGLVRLLVNEIPKAIPGCGTEEEAEKAGYFCDWATFKQLLEKAGSGCDFEACCTSLNGNSTAPDSSSSSSTSGPAPVCLTVDPIQV